MSEPALERISQNPDILDGQPTIRNTGVAVKAVIDQLMTGKTVDAILTEHSELETEDILQVLIFTIQRVTALHWQDRQEINLPLASIWANSEWLVENTPMPDEKSAKAIKVILTEVRSILNSLRSQRDEYRKYIST